MSPVEAALAWHLSCAAPVLLLATVYAAYRASKTMPALRKPPVQCPGVSYDPEAADMISDAQGGTDAPASPSDT